MKEDIRNKIKSGELKILQVGFFESIIVPAEQYEQKRAELLKEMFENSFTSQHKGEQYGL